MLERAIKILDGINKQANSIYRLFKRFLRYLRVNDEKNMISLTNIAMILILYKIATTTASSMEDIGLLLAVLSSYQAKRWMEMNGKGKEPDEES